jgi:hypothetical protein
VSLTGDPIPYELPDAPTAEEASLTARLGPEGLRAIDTAIIQATQDRWHKVARVVSDALSAGGFPSSDDHFDLHVRRVIALVGSGALEGKGNLRRPRWSEVRLPQDEP